VCEENVGFGTLLELDKVEEKVGKFENVGFCKFEKVAFEEKVEENAGLENEEKVGFEKLDGKKKLKTLVTPTLVCNDQLRVHHLCS